MSAFIVCVTPVWDNRDFISGSRTVVVQGLPTYEVPELAVKIASRMNYKAWGENGQEYGDWEYRAVCSDGSNPHRALAVMQYETEETDPFADDTH